jgi:hypothetical protein
MPHKSRQLVQSIIVCSCFVLPLAGCSDIAKMALEKIGESAVSGTTDEGMRRLFEQADAACPRRMDAYTTLENVEMIDDTSVEFRYLVNDAGKQFMSGMEPQKMRKNAVESMQGNAMAVAIADRDLSVEHIYEDAAGDRILAFTINRAVLDGDEDALGKKRFNPFDVEALVESALFADPKKSSIGQGEIGPEVAMPQEFRPTSDHPAGLQSNPFFAAEP